MANCGSPARCEGNGFESVLIYSAGDDRVLTGEEAYGWEKCEMLR